MSATTLLNVEAALGSIGSTGSAPVTLGPLTLQGVEVPSVLNVGGEQSLAVRKLLGGAHVIQTMGPDPAPITLSGMFTGPGALGRAQQLAGLRDVGMPLRLGFAGVSLMVVIRPSSYTYQQQGAVIPFQVTVEIQPTVVAAPSSGPSALSSLVGPDIASAATAVSNGIAQGSAFASDVIAQTQSVVGQITPFANLLGVGGPLAAASNQLTAAGGLAIAGTNFAAAPAAAASTITALSSACASLQTTIDQSGANIEGITAAAGPGNLVADMPSLLALTANMGAHAAAVQAGAYAGRATLNVQLASGTTTTPGLTHA